MVLANRDHIRQTKLRQRVNERPALDTIQRVREDKVNGKALVDEAAHEITSDARLTLIGVIRFEAAVRLEDLKQQRKRHIVEHPIGVD